MAWQIILITLDRVALLKSTQKPLSNPRTWVNDTMNNLFIFIIRILFLTYIMAHLKLCPMLLIQHSFWISLLKR